jgi:hypothetical protein
MTLIYSHFKLFNFKALLFFILVPLPLVGDFYSSAPSANLLPYFDLPLSIGDGLRLLILISPF